MAGFLYTIPKVKTVSGKCLEEAGLADRLCPGMEVAQVELFIGPGGGDCVLLLRGNDTKLLRYRPDEQSWQLSRNGKYWIGMYNDPPNRPTPTDLTRPDQIAGHEIETEPGQKWCIPCARMFPVGTCLPQSMILGPEGKVIKEIISKFAGFSARAQALWDDFMVDIGWKKGEVKLTVEEQFALVTEAISLNYYCGIDEINLLKFLTTQNFEKMIYAIVDAPTLMKAIERQIKSNDQKKTGSAEGG